MASLISHIPAMDCMKQIQHKYYNMGTPLKTLHREVMPG